MRTRHFSQFPKPYFAYPKVIQGLILKNKKLEQRLPEVEYVVDAFHVDAKHLRAYNQICGFANNGYVPAIYFAVLSQSLQMQMMTQEAFPFAVLGLVHIHNQVTQYKPLAANFQYRLVCRFGELKPHHKGQQFEFITEVYIGNELVMQGVSTYLARQKTTQTVVEKAAEKANLEWVLQDHWSIHENTGCRYALVSGDANPIHLHALTAKAFGFKQAIAHGMWTKAKALAALSLPEKYQADVSFKLPVFLPSDVELLTHQQSKTVSQFLIRSAKSHKPHVVGQISSL
jgi:acyl dehydratase